MNFMDDMMLAAGLGFLDEILEDEKDDELEVVGLGRDELEAAGLDRDDLELMDEDERREALEDAGLDPDDYDFLI